LLRLKIIVIHFWVNNFNSEIIIYKKAPTIVRAFFILKVSAPLF